MKKSDIIKALEQFSDEDDILLGDDLTALWQLQPRAICGKRQAYMVYTCVKQPGHDGECWCSCKDVNFIPDTPEEYAALVKLVNS